MVMKMVVQLQNVAAIKTKVEMALAGIGTGGIAFGRRWFIRFGAAIKAEEWQWLEMPTALSHHLPTTQE